MELPRVVKASRIGMSAGTAAALTVTLGLAAGSWVVTVWRMSGMDMGAASFLARWVPMTAAMMMPAIAPTVLRLARASGRVRTAPLFVGSYLAVWTLVGLAAYPMHGALTAGAVAIVAGVYELTPLKRHFRRRCREDVHSGFRFGLYCVGSCIGLMLMARPRRCCSMSGLIMVC